VVRVSVVVTTYNAPRELDLVLCGLARQTRPPDEVLVADDGSTEETARLIVAWKSELPTLVHVRHADRGYRKSRIANLAVHRSTGEHLLFLDGDAIPHSRWVADHEHAADGRRVLCGRRVKLGPPISAALDKDTVGAGRLESLAGPVLRSVLGGGTRRFLLGVRLPAVMARLFHPRARKLMGVNFSLPRAAFSAVNGYDEAWQVPWREDRDLELRLLRAEVPFYPLLNRAVVYHQWHETRPFGPESQAINETIESRSIVRCEQGLSEHEGVTPDPS
jgi:glycosyltransferase involved in cell wall biosynthesis